MYNYFNYFGFNSVFKQLIAVILHKKNMRRFQIHATIKNTKLCDAFYIVAVGIFIELRI